jgi:hypothetical protein
VSNGDSQDEDVSFVLELNIVQQTASLLTLKEKRDSLGDDLGTSDSWNERRFLRVYSPAVSAVSFCSQIQRASHNFPSTDAQWPLQTSVLFQLV